MVVPVSKASLLGFRDCYMLDADSKGNLGELNMPLACRTQNNESTVQTIGPSVRDAVDSGARIINMSFGYGDVSDAIFRDYMLYALRHGVVMVSGRSNGSWAGYMIWWALRHD